jgi:hypothetical protein
VSDHAIGTWTHLQLFGEFFPLLRDSVINFDAIAVIAAESFYERMTDNASRLDWGRRASGQAHPRASNPL